jgi:hypothetical protein
MIGTSVWSLVFGLAGCDTTTTVQGHVVDAMSGKPAGGYSVVANATNADVALTCKTFQTTVAEDGTFTLDTLCSDTSYALSSDREEVWFADAAEVGGDAAPEGVIEVKVWKAPKNPGLYRLDAAGTLEGLTTTADVKTERIRGSDERVRYPSTIPKTVPTIGPDDSLVFVGQDAIDGLKVHPLIPSGMRVFGDDVTKVTMDPWNYVGITFTDDTTYTMSTATIDAAKVVDKSGADRVVRYVPGTAIAAGRYAVLRDDDVRMMIIDFGAPSTDAAVADGEPAAGEMPGAADAPGAGEPAGDAPPAGEAPPTPPQ